MFPRLSQVLLFALIWKTPLMPFTYMPTPAITDRENSCILEAILSGAWAAGSMAVVHPPAGTTSKNPLSLIQAPQVDGRSLSVIFGQVLQAHIHTRSHWDAQDSWSMQAALGASPHRARLRCCVQDTACINK